jgi:hypothetical protein
MVDDVSALRGSSTADIDLRRHAAREGQSVRLRASAPVALKAWQHGGGR